MIEPEAVPPAPRTRRHRRAVVAGVTLLAVVAGGIAVALDGGGPEAKPLALLAGNSAAGKAESMAAQLGAPAPVAPALGAAADSRSAMYPYGGWGLKFEVEGQLPALPDHATAWRVNGPNLDRAAIVRIAGALGVTGTPVQRDGGWFVEGGDWTMSAFGGDTVGKGSPWYVNLYRSRFAGGPDDAAGNEPPAGPAISRADAERRVRELLDRMGAPEATWRVETTDTEIASGGWACAAPYTPEDLKKLEGEKLAQLERENAASSSSGATTVADPAPPSASASGSASGAGSSGSAGRLIAPVPGSKPAPDGGVPSCPPPPAPVKGFNVNLYPVLDGRRADWPVWNVTMRSDGRIENLSGSWVTFERGGDYKLRGVEAALKELQSPPVPYAVDTPAAIEPTIAVDPANAFPATGPAEASDAAQPKTSAGSAPSRLPLRDNVGSSPAVDLPAEAPVCPPMAMPMPMPMPAQDDKATSSIRATCAPPAPQVVKITGVELGLIQTSVFENGQVRLALVPSYRFTGHFAEGGTPWETSVVALHPDAIAPPPDYPVSNDVQSGGGSTGVGSTGVGSTGVGKAVPPTPTPEPAIARDSSR